jgi:hypothetical protein
MEDESLAATLGEDRFVDEPSKGGGGSVTVPFYVPTPVQGTTEAVTDSDPSFQQQLQNQTPNHSHQQPMRRRLDTEETHRVRNVVAPGRCQQSQAASGSRSTLSLGDADRETDPDHGCNDTVEKVLYNHERYTYPLEQNLHEVPSADDDGTIVSSLSNDEDSLILVQRTAVLSPVLERDASHRTILPPMEVTIPTPVSNPDQRESLMEKLVARLAIRHTSPPRPLSTRDPSPLVERPTMGRNRSCPVRMDFSVASSMFSSNRSGTTYSYSIPEDAILVNGMVMDGIRNRNGDLSVGDMSSHHALLGNRKRRVHRRSYTGTEISVGSIVGQSTLLTAPTATASITDSEASSVRRALRSAHSAEEMLLSYTGAGDGIGCCQVRRPKNIVKEEFKYVAGKLASPIRMIPLFKEKKAELKRAKGSLV